MMYDINIIEHNVKKVANNTTVHSYEIKLRGDRVYDLYLDGKWIISRGSQESILEELKALMKENV